MSQSERIRHLQEQANRFVSRNQCVDSSLLTLKRQAQASKNLLEPAGIETKVIENGCCRTVTKKGKGTQMEYTAILQKAQGCAICPSTPPTDTGVAPVIALPVPCINDALPPFAQQAIATGYPAPYVPPCTDPGNRHYFPEKPVRGDGANCDYQHLPYDS